MKEIFIENGGVLLEPEDQLSPEDEVEEYGNDEGGAENIVG